MTPPIIVLLLLVTARCVLAQQSPPAFTYGETGPLRANFNAATAVLIIVVVSSFFFLAFFSLYLRRCSRDRSAIAPAGAGAVTATSRRGARRGLDPAAIEKFPILSYSAVAGLKIGKEILECAVCLSEFSDVDTLRMLPKCCHVFHPECIDTWLESHVTCPVCRDNLSAVAADDSEAGPTDGDGLEIPGAEEGDIADDDAAAVCDGEVAINLTRIGRSHSTGHVTGGGDRFTLRLPEHVRREILTAASLRRSASVAVLDRYFTKVDLEGTPQKHLKEEAPGLMQQMMTLVQNTSELYHELHALDRFEQEYRRKLQEEENSNVTQRGDNSQILRQDLKSQRKHVKSLKKKSLWSKSLEDVIEKLVDIVHFLHLEIRDSFGPTADGDQPVKKSVSSHQRLGSAGLALHYANIISQIDTLASRSSSVPSNTRDSLYQGLPPRVKSALRSKLQAFQAKEELTASQIKSEMEKTLRWLVPIANNTTKAHHGFGWVGEWANTGTELNRDPGGPSDLIRIETLYHADKEKTESFILDLVVWLHHLISRSMAGKVCVRSPLKSPIRSPTERNTAVSPTINSKSRAQPSALSHEDEEMLRDVSNWKHTPGISKSQEFETGRARLSKAVKLSKSSSHSPMTECVERDAPPTRRPAAATFDDIDIDKIKALDIIDRVDTLRNL